MGTAIRPTLDLTLVTFANDSLPQDTVTTTSKTAAVITTTATANSVTTTTQTSRGAMTVVTPAAQLLLRVAAGITAYPSHHETPKDPTVQKPYLWKYYGDIEIRPDTRPDGHGGVLIHLKGVGEDVVKWDTNYPAECFVVIQVGDDDLKIRSELVKIEYASFKSTDLSKDE